MWYNLDIASELELEKEFEFHRRGIVGNVCKSGAIDQAGSTLLQGQGNWKSRVACLCSFKTKTFTIGPDCRAIFEDTLQIIECQGELGEYLTLVKIREGEMYWLVFSTKRSRKPSCPTLVSRLPMRSLGRNKWGIAKDAEPASTWERKEERAGPVYRGKIIAK